MILKAIGCMANPQAMADYLGAKKASKEYKLHYMELVSEELQIITRTFLRQWSSNRIDFLGSRMLQSPPFLPTQTQAQMLHTFGLLFVAKLRKYMQKKHILRWLINKPLHCHYNHHHCGSSVLSVVSSHATWHAVEFLPHSLVGNFCLKFGFNEVCLWSF